MPNATKLLFFAAGILVLLGIFFWLGKGRNPFWWFGNLPGDFKSEGGNFGFYAPIASMLVLSLAFHLLTRVYHWFFGT
jgi:hypothetical protein